MLSTVVLERPPRARRKIALRGLLIAGFAAQVLLRLWVSRYHAGPVANPDEAGYLAAARWLAGGPGVDFSGTTFYRGGYPLLLAPIHWVTSDPETVYRLVVVAGSVAAASAFPLAYLLLLLRFGTGRRGAAVLAFAAALAPPGLLFSGLALADAILPSLLLGWLIAVHDLVRYGSARAGMLAGGLAAYAMAVHLRGTVVLAVFAVLAAGLLLVRRRPGVAAGLRAAAVAAVVVAAVVAVAGQGLNAAVAAAIYPRGPRDLTALAVSRFTTVDGQAWALSGAAGQLWYLICGTWGLAGVGLAGAAVVAVRRGGPVAHRVTAAALLAVTLGIAYASSAALPDEHRVGNYAYGRYLSCVAVAWLLAGLVVLVRARRATALRYVAAAAALLAATGGIAAWYAGDRLRRYAFIAFDFPETSFLSGVRDALDMAGASRAALVLLACLAAACLFTRRRTRILVAVIVLAAVHTAFAADLAPKAPPAPARGWLQAPPPGGVAVDTRVRWGIWVPLTHRVWWTALDMYDGRRQGPPPDACSAVVPPGAGPPPAGWAATGEGGTAQGWTAWINPSCPAS
ncbi:hypothetical protein [Nonomuraea sp. SBT364]|uniref:hypothetical protein n=1 Tax=Nonomuraea sp. SBT364 TaxID=1580530 RepID=UPI00066A797F|nr:hypothetical protein [Nonomuraea sp. SBT364]